MVSARITRRRAVGLGMAAGLGSLLARTPVPAAASPRTFGMVPRLGETLRARRRFDLVGLRGTGIERAQLEIRTRPLRGRWTPWIPIHTGADHRPDPTPARPDSAHASDPIWVDGARELQLRARGPLPGDLRLHFVAVPVLARRAGVRMISKLRAAAPGPQLGGPPMIITRAQWGARPPRASSGYGEVQMAFVHHTVTANDYDPEDTPAIVQSIQHYHQSTNGWLDIGYNFLVDKYGQIFEGRAGGVDQPIIGAQAQGFNDDSTGISNIGTYSSVGQTPEAIEALSRLIAWKLSLHGAPVEGTIDVISGGGSANKYKAGTSVAFQRISGHRDGGKTSCPGTALYGQLAQIRLRAAQIAPEFANVVARLTMVRSESAIPYGETLTLTGRLRRVDGTPVAGSEVILQKRGTSNWVSIAKATTDAAGGYVLSMPWRSGGRVRTRAEVDGGLVVSAAGTVACVPVLQRISRRAKASPRAVVKGRARPAGTFNVLVERSVGGGYTRIGSFVVKSRGSSFKARLPLRKAGRYRLTPTVTSGAKTVKGRSSLLRARK